MAHATGAYPYKFYSMEETTAEKYCYSPPGWDASPLQGYPQQCVAGTHLYTWVKRDNVDKSFL